MKKILIVLAVLSVSGCASFGNKNYGCNGLPEGTKCESTRNIYEQTHGGGTKVNNKNGDSEEIVEYRDTVIDTFVTPNLPDRPIPVRTPAQVMRIWINTYEDENNALITTGKVHVDIEPRKWVIGKPDDATQMQNRLFKPLAPTSKLHFKP